MMGRVPDPWRETLRHAKSLARLLRKAGTSREDARARIAGKYELSAQAIESILVSTYGK